MTKSNGEIKKATGKTLISKNKSKRSFKEDIQRKIIINNVFRLRDERKLTNSELARLLRFSISTISSWESGSRGITAATLPRLAEIFNIDISELFKDNGVFAVKEDDPREVKFQRIRSLLYEFSLEQLECVDDAITSIWKLIYEVDGKKQSKSITYDKNKN